MLLSLSCFVFEIGNFMFNLDFNFFSKYDHYLYASFRLNREKLVTKITIYD